MTQPTERRFVMEPRLDAEVETLNTAISAEATARTNADATKVAKAGDTMTGALTLNADPTNSLHAATKQYVDTADALKVAKAGDTMTGALVLPADPTLALQAATKQYVDNSVATGTTSGSRTLNVKNGASSLTKGQPVYISSADGTNIIISAAGNGSEATSSKTIGLVTTALSANAMGVVITNGLLSGLDTSGAGTAGDPVWLGPSGTLLYGLAAKPVAPAHLVYIGIVTKKNASTGEILVNPQNGFELDELHNVLITSPTNGQSLTYDNATGLWKNSTPASSLDSLTDVTINSGTLSGGQVIKYDAGTTQWVNGAAAGGVTAAATAPNLATSAAGDAWFDTNDGTLYVCYIDADSTKQWVQVQANSALEASILSRLGALEASNIAAGTTSPNYLINGAFDIWQRGTSFTNPAAFTAFTADRWTQGFDGTGATRTWSQQVHTPGAAPVAGATESSYFLRLAQSVAGSGGSYNMLVQRIEDVRTLAGQTVTFSFYAKAGSALTMPSIDFEQSFGSGGSANVYTTLTSSISVGTSWTRYSYSVALPSISGKTIGTNPYLGIRIFLPFNTTFTFDIANVQLERGTVATTFRRNQPNIQAELAACQRYYFRLNGSNRIALGFQSGTTQAQSFHYFPVDMRIIPSTIDYSGLTWSDGIAGSASVSSAAYYSGSTQMVEVRSVISSYGAPNRPGCLVGGYIGFSAEL